MKKFFLVLFIGFLISSRVTAQFSTSMTICMEVRGFFIFDTSMGGDWYSTDTNAAIITSFDPYSCTIDTRRPGVVNIIHVVGGGTTIFTLHVIGIDVDAYVITECIGESVAGWVHFITSDTSSYYSTSGGTWFSLDSTIISVDHTSGLITGVSAGDAFFGFSADVVEWSDFCWGEQIMHVFAPDSVPITGPSTVCLGYTIALTDSFYGGPWTASNANATVTAGVVSGLTPGIDTIFYTVPSMCMTRVSYVITINPLLIPYSISGATSVCTGATIILSDAASGGTWSVRNANATISSGVLSGVIAGLDTINYTVSNICGTANATYPITINASPTISASFTDGCGDDTLTATGATTYSWLPTSGLLCNTCSITGFSPLSTTVYTVTGTTTGCSSTTTLSVDGNKISGYISFSSIPPSSPSLKVWLVQYNSVDSSLIGIDSTLTCLSGGTMPYFEFNDKPAGNYMVKSQLIGSIPGASGYIPTYAYTSPHWDSASTIIHSSSADTLNINMLYGTVPSGTGFISGLIVSGAGKRTTGEVPAPNILVYLEDTLQHLFTYTYTDSIGHYLFTGLAYGNYVIYPTDFSYYTTPSAIISLNSTSPSDTNINFKEHTTLGIITPFLISLQASIIDNKIKIAVTPNPSTGKLYLEWSGLTSTNNINVSICDITGREVYTTWVNTNVSSNSYCFDVSFLSNGLYILNCKSAGLNYTTKIEIEH